jgi:hypothetical protein
MEDTDILMIYLIVFPSLLVTLCAPVLDLARQPQGGHPRQGGGGGPGRRGQGREAGQAAAGGVREGRVGAHARHTAGLTRHYFLTKN